MSNQFIIDTSSLINFFRYHYFDKNNGTTLYNKLLQFMIDKIKAGEIIVIDKVYNELQSRDSVDFKKAIKKYVVNTDDLLSNVEVLSNNYYIADNERLVFHNDQNQIDTELNIEKSSADLFLVAHCINLKNSGLKPILITEETTNTKQYRKLIEKIPTICRNEHIEYRAIAYLLFELYKTELIFSLKVN